MTVLPIVSRSSTPARILVVEDDTQVRSLLTQMLRTLGYVVHGAGCSREALAEIDAAPPDLVLLDLHLPDGCGQSILEQIRNDGRARFLPVIMLTGHSTRAERLQALATGVSDFMSKPFDSEELTVRIEALLRLKSFTDRLEEAEQVIVALARAIDARDPYTAGHSERVAEYAELLGRRIGLGAQDLATLRRGSLFHDVGKIAVCDDVLRKVGRLTVPEIAEMRRHPVEGRVLIQHLRTLTAAVPIIYHHHEKLDGSGYPGGLGGEEIPGLVRVVSIADVYDALTSPRPYRSAYPQAEALQIMEEEARREWWDVELLREFKVALEQRASGHEPAAA